jgi:hypothetical protein
MYPTNKDTPLVPIRGLWVTGIHRSIFDIDHVVQITDIESSKSSIADYTSIEKAVKDDGCSLTGVVMVNGSKVPVQKYTSTDETTKDDGCSILGIVTLNENINVNKYKTVNESMKEDDGCSILGIIALNNNVNISWYTDRKYSSVCDSHGLFVAGLSTSRVSVTNQLSISSSKEE